MSRSEHLTKRLTTRIPDGLAEALDKEVENGTWANESEAVRAGLREVLNDIPDSEE